MHKTRNIRIQSTKDVLIQQINRQKDSTNKFLTLLKIKQVAKNEYELGQANRLGSWLVEYTKWSYPQRGNLSKESLGVDEAHKSRRCLLFASTHSLCAQLFLTILKRAELRWQANRTTFRDLFLHSSISHFQHCDSEIVKLSSPSERSGFVLGGSL